MPHIIHKGAFGDLQLQLRGVDGVARQHLAHQGADIVAAELMGGKIHRHGQRRQPCLAPGAGLATGLVQHPAAHRHDHAGFLQGGDELAGRHQALLRVAPAQQRLHPHHAVTAQVQLGLVVQHELVAFQGAAQLAFQVQALEGARVHVGGIETVATATLGLGAVHGRVGVAQQRFRVTAILGVHADADAETEKEFLTFQHEGMAHGVQQFLQDGRHVLGVVQVLQQDGELVPAQARHGVALAQTFGQPPCHGAQQPVAGAVPQGIVDLLEAVQVQE